MRSLPCAERKETMLEKWRMLAERARLWLLQRLGLLSRCDYINGAQTLPPPLTREEEAQVLARLQSEPERAREILITRNLRLVVYIARRFENTGVGLEDLISIGTIGLIKGVNTFSTNKNIKLATYASRCIENEILMHLRKVSRQKEEISLAAPLNVDWNGNELLLSDVLGTEGDAIHREMEIEAEKTALSRCIDGLNGREKLIMQLRFGLTGKPEQTQKEVADRIGISQSYISRLEKRIIRRLRGEMEKEF